MEEYYTVKQCCLICDYARLEHIDDHDMLIPCAVSANGIMPCMEMYDCCEKFLLNRDLNEQIKEGVDDTERDLR